MKRNKLAQLESLLNEKGKTVSFDAVLTIEEKQFLKVLDYRHGDPTVVFIPFDMDIKIVRKKLEIIWQKIGIPSFTITFGNYSYKNKHHETVKTDT